MVIALDALHNEGALFCRVGHANNAPFFSGYRHGYRSGFSRTFSPHGASTVVVIAQMITGIGGAASGNVTKPSVNPMNTSGHSKPCCSIHSNTGSTLVPP